MTAFDDIVNRQTGDCLKWDTFRDRKVLPLWVADMDFASPPAIVEALQARVKHGLFGYPLPPEELVDVIAKRFHAYYGWPIAREWLVWLPGVVPGLAAACQAFTQPGDEVVVFTPVYPPFLSLPQQFGRTTVPVRLACEAGRYSIDAEAFAHALTPRTRLLLLCQPHNPVGRVFSDGELRPVLELCKTRRIVVCSDEIHCDLILDGRCHRPVASLDAAASATRVTLMSPGKTFNTAGLNFGFAVVPDPDLRQRLCHACRYSIPQPTVLAYAAALAAYRDCEPWRRSLLQILTRNAEVVRQTVSEALPKVAMGAIEATYLAWLDARGLGHPDPCALFLEHGVALSDGAAFGAPGFVRLNFGCPAAHLQEALLRMARAAQSLHG